MCVCFPLSKGCRDPRACAIFVKEGGLEERKDRKQVQILVAVTLKGCCDTKVCALKRGLIKAEVIIQPCNAS